MLKKQKLSLICLAASGLFVSSASAAITYWVDSANQQIIFNGSWSGGIPNGGNYVDWVIEGLSAPMSSSSVNPISGSLTDTGGTSSNSLIYFAAEVGSQPGQGVNLMFDIIFSEHSGTPSTLTIEDLTFSYNTFTQEVKDFINQLPTLQTAMQPRDGTGYSPITYAAIPEASHIGLILGAGAAALLVRRRMKQNRKAIA